MSRTKRDHWLREGMRDGVKRTKVKTRRVNDKDGVNDWFLRTEGEYEWTCFGCGVEVEYGTWECEDCK